jgi:hypothetical protein
MSLNLKASNKSLVAEKTINERMAALNNCLKFAEKLRTKTECSRNQVNFFFCFLN